MTDTDTKNSIVENLKWLKIINWVDDPLYGEKLDKLKIVPIAFDNEEKDATSFTNLLNEKTYKFYRGRVVSCYDEIKVDCACEDCFAFDYNTDLFLHEIRNFHDDFWIKDLPKDKQIILKAQQRKIEKIIMDCNLNSSEKPLFDKKVVINIANKVESLFNEAYTMDFEIKKQKIDTSKSKVNIFHYEK